MAENNNADVKINATGGAQAAGSGKVKFSERLNGFVQKNRKALALCLCLVIVGIAGFIVFSVVSGSLLEKAWSRVEEYSSRYDAVKLAGSGSFETQRLEDELSDFVKNKSGFPAARAYSLIALINQDNLKWAEAETAWVNAANAAPKTYFAPVSFFHAGLAAEEYGNISSAIGYYEKALQMADIFPDAPRAQFSVGRLQEAQGNKTAAIETYRALADRRPADQFWGSLAQSRILFLEGR